MHFFWLTQNLKNRVRRSATRQGAVLFLLTIGITACSMEARLFNLNSDDLKSGVQDSHRSMPDYIAGETVITSGGNPGYEVKAVFGEIPQKTQSLNGNQWKIDGVFYE